MMYFCLKYQDDDGDVTVTLHHDREDAELYRAWYVANLVGAGLVEHEPTADIITAHMFSGDFQLAYEAFMQWVDEEELAYDFVIELLAVSPPVSQMEIFDMLLDNGEGDPNTDESAVEIIDTRKVPQQVAWQDVIDASTPKADLVESPANRESTLAYGYRDMHVDELRRFLDNGTYEAPDDEEEEASFEFDAHMQLKEMKRIDGKHCDRENAIVTLLRTSRAHLTEAQEAVKEMEQARPWPLMKHRIKGEERRGEGERGKDVSV